MPLVSTLLTPSHQTALTQRHRDGSKTKKIASGAVRGPLCLLKRCLGKWLRAGGRGLRGVMACD